jgi:predicted flap endonuclease-1-like 5' DNA nuclease
MRELERTLFSATEEREAEIRRLRVRIGEVEALDVALQDREQRIQELEETHRMVIADHERTVSRLNALLSAHDAQSNTIRVQQIAPDTRIDEKDDLKRIHGVGPMLERMLNDIGVHTFREVALWTDQDIDRVDAQLAHFQGRIRREGWVQSARNEHVKKYRSEP